MTSFFGRAEVLGIENVAMVNEGDTARNATKRQELKYSQVCLGFGTDLCKRNYYCTSHKCQPPGGLFSNGISKIKLAYCVG